MCAGGLAPRSVAPGAPVMGSKGAGDRVPLQTQEDVDRDVDELVSEYLQYHRYAGALRVFEEERAERAKKVAEARSSGPGNVYLSDAVQNEVLSRERRRAPMRMMEAFEAGDRRAFFEFWETHIPVKVRNDLETGGHEEFAMHVYFAIFPVHEATARQRRLRQKTGAGQETLTQSMAAFKVYLDTGGHRLAQRPEFLAFYALPFVPEPQAHPSFSEIFETAWVSERRYALEHFLAEALDSTAARPRLYAMYERLIGMEGDIDENGPTGVTPLLPEPSPGDSPRPREASHGSPQDVRKKSVSFSQNLTESPNFERILSDNDPSGGGGVIDERGGQFGELPADLATLNYDIIRTALGGPPRTGSVAGEEAGPLRKAALLQALRWRIARSRPGQSRSRVLKAYQEFDLLGLSEPGGHTSTLRALCEDESPLVREYTMRLCNVMASSGLGRAYMANTTSADGGEVRGVAVVCLCDMLTSEDRDTLLMQNALGALQKLSLRRAAQTRMVHEGIVEWTLGLLKDSVDGETLSEYTIEYSCALLMNLSLRTSGKRACAKSEHNALMILAELARSENVQVRTYVNGTLYSILALPEMRMRALEMDLPNILEVIKGESTEQFALQIDYIILQINKPAEEGAPPSEEAEDVSSDDGAGDDDDDVIHWEADDSAGDGWNIEEEEEEETLPDTSIEPGLRGEELLLDGFALEGMEAQRDELRVSASLRLEADLANSRRSSTRGSSRGQQSTQWEENPLGVEEGASRPVTPRSGSKPSSTRGNEAGQVSGGEVHEPGETAAAEEAELLQRDRKAAERAIEKLQEAGMNPDEIPTVDEYMEAFHSRAKVVRTPAPGDLPSEEYE